MKSMQWAWSLCTPMDFKLNFIISPPIKAGPLLADVPGLELTADASALEALPVMAQAVLQLMALLTRGELSMRADRWVDCTDLSA